MLRNFTGTVATMAGGTLQSGFIRLTPVGATPGALAPVPKLYIISDGVIAASTIDGGVEYLVEVFDPNLKAVYPDFHATVTDIADPITWAEIYASANTHVPPATSLTDVINARVAAIGPVTLIGTWNAATNTPALASGAGTKGSAYVVATAGTTALDGINVWAAGDWAVFDGTVWRKVNNADSAGGGGDMTKAVYDPNDDGKVNTAVLADEAKTAQSGSALRTELDGKAATVHTHEITDVTDLTNQLGAKIPFSQKGAANGVAELDANGVLPLAQLPAAVIGGVSYQGTWDAAANTPPLASGVGTKGHYYRVATAGATALDGITDWKVGDWAIFDGTVWQKVDNTDQVTSVAGRQGDVTLAIADTGGLQAALDDKAAATHEHAAADITSGVLDAARVPNLDAAKVTTGVFPVARLATGTPDGTKFIRDDGTLAMPGSSIYKAGYFNRRAAILEPGALRSHVGFEILEVPTTKTIYHQYSWNLRALRNGLRARFENRDATGGPIPLRGISLTGMQYASFGWYLDIEGITYANAEDEYYRKLALIDELVTRYRANTLTAVGSVVSMIGPHGSIAWQAAGFDKAWFALGEENGDAAGSPTGASAPDDDVHQETRMTDSFFANPVVLSLDTFVMMGGGKGFDWGFALTGARSHDTDPMNWFLYVNLPLSFRGTAGDVVAPNGYLHSISTVNDYVLPDNITATNGAGGGLVDIHPQSEWLRLTAGTTAYGTGWICNDVFDPEAGRAVVFEYKHESGNRTYIGGIGQGTGVANADFTHAIQITANVISVHHDAGAGRVSRTFAGFNLVAGHVYRFKITFGASGNAFYEMQTSHDDPADPQLRLSHPLGSNHWYDLLEGTTTATGAGFTGLRMKGSIGGTAGDIVEIAWPRTALTHAGATSTTPTLLKEYFGGPTSSETGYPVFKMHDKRPFPIQPPSLARWTSASTEWNTLNETVSPYRRGVSHLSGSVGSIPLRLNVGVADIDFTIKWDFKGAGDGTFFGIHFNANSDNSSKWLFAIRPSDGMVLTQDPAGNNVDLVVLGALANGDVSFRVRTVGDLVQTWIKVSAAAAWQQITNSTIASRANKTNTWVAIAPTGENASILYGGADGPEIIAAYA